MDNVNLEKPVEISTDIYWIGSSEEALLRRNIYLRVFKGNNRQYSMIIDPGPPVDLTVMIEKVTAIIGGLNNLNFIFINHQDPDVVYNATYIQKVNSKALTLMTEDTWRLVQFYGLNPNNFAAVEKFSRMRAKIRSGQVLEFVPTPFCHFRGACMYYDRDSRVLFSGDFLGGISTSDLYAKEHHWEGVKAFHQLYMPSREALRYSVEKIRSLDPQPVMIAPQHGAILTGDIMELFLSRMEELPVGIDLLTEVDTDLDVIIDTANEITSTTENVLGTAIIEEVFELFHPDGSYPAIFTVGKNNIIRDIKGDPLEAIEALVQVVLSMCNDEQASELKASFQNSLVEKNIAMIPSLDEDADENNALG